MIARKYMSLLLGGLLYATFALSGSVLANPIGDSYSFASQNFPIDIAPGGLMTFNVSGDLTPEVEPDSGNSLYIIEQFFAGAGPNSGDLLAFQFSFTSYPTDPDAPFAFLISGLDWVDLGVNTLLSASLAIDFGVSSLPQTAVNLFTTAFDLDGLNLLFQSPVTWSEIYAMTAPPVGAGPTQIVTTFVAEINHAAQVPEPSILFLLVAGGLGYFWTTKHRPHT